MRGRRCRSGSAGRRESRTVASALATATVGMAVPGGSGDIAAETADAILLGDNLLHVGETLQIARRTLKIAKQSILVGLGLSVLGMGLAAVGILPPVGGTLFQEAIDVTVILNALRRIGRAARRRLADIDDVTMEPILFRPLQRH